MRLAFKKNPKTWRGWRWRIHFGSVTVIVVLMCQQFTLPHFCTVSADVLTVKKAHNFFYCYENNFDFVSPLNSQFTLWELLRYRVIGFRLWCRSVGEVLGKASLRKWFLSHVKGTCGGFEGGQVVCVIKEPQEDQYTGNIVFKGKSTTKRGQFIWDFRTNFKNFGFYPLTMESHWKTF